MAEIQLQRLTLKGFKTYRSLDLTLADMNVMIGPNGAGKSNLVAFFRLLSWMTASQPQLRVFVGQSGGAATFLSDGPALTREIDAELTIRTGDGTNQYGFRLVYAAGDTLIFVDERYRFSSSAMATTAPWKPLGVGQSETGLIARADGGDRTAKLILHLLRGFTVFQFHNTSYTSRMRRRWDVEDGRYLKEDAANIGPFLYRLRETRAPYYRRIVQTLSQILPFFADFVLEPIDGRVLLQWQEVGTDMVFGAHLASDGMLRAMALVTLLLQPIEDLPSLIILDEPEFGLHPFALSIVAGLLKAASRHRQVIVATQSTGLIDLFEPADILVVDRVGRASTIRRLDPAPLDELLAEYSLSQLFEKNVLGGRPG